MFYDTHVHFQLLGAAVSEAIDRAVAGDVRKMLAVGGTPEANELVLDLAAQYSTVEHCSIRAALGFDRDYVPCDLDLALLKEQVARAEVVAVGEIGLDYYYAAERAREQRELFAAMLAVAREARLPVIVHTREAAADTLAMLREHVALCSGLPGVIHCFTGDLALAKGLLDLGFYLSFSGILTFKNAAEIRLVAAFVPADRLLIETDSPFLAPVPYRGRPNEPAWVVQVAAALSELRDVPLADIAAITTANAERLLQRF